MMSPLLILCLVPLLQTTEIKLDHTMGMNDPQMHLGEAGGSTRKLCPDQSKFWGPGLNPGFNMPVRYFYIQAVDSDGHNFTVSLGNVFKVSVSKDDGQHKVRAWADVIDRQSGVYLARIRLFEEVGDLTVDVKLKTGAHVKGSPFRIAGPLFHEGCACSEPDTAEWAETMQCKSNYSQIDQDIDQFRDISVVDLATQAHKKFDSHYHLGHYVILDNRAYSKMIGEHTGLNRKFDDMLLSLMAKVNLPDMEFIVNLRDGPIEKSKVNPMPILSFGGSRDSADIALPSYELTDAVLKSMHKTDIDLQNIQGNIGPEWKSKIPIGFWRGRDSREQRLDLARLSMSYPEKVDAKLTQALFFKHVPSMYGDIVPKIPFREFFDYKFQITVDGMVSAYRVPFILGGPSVVFKQDSFFYEHFYADIEPWVHYVPFNHNLNNLIQRLNWAQENDHLAHIISENARHFVRTELKPSDVYCYVYRLFNRYAEKQYGKVEVRKGMHELSKKRSCFKCPYNTLNKSEL